MRVDELKTLNTCAPTKGTALVYTRDKVQMFDYYDLSQVKEEYKNDDLVEIHLFDREKEYRAVKSVSRRYKGAVVAVLDFPNDENVYEEKTELIDGEYCLTILNHISYDQDGLLSIDMYRLVKGEKEDGSV